MSNATLAFPSDDERESDMAEVPEIDLTALEGLLEEAFLVDVR
jgi:hypothetical protein